MILTLTFISRRSPTDSKSMACGSHRNSFTVPPLESLQKIRRGEGSHIEHPDTPQAAFVSTPKEYQYPRCKSRPVYVSLGQPSNPTSKNPSHSLQQEESRRRRPVEYVGGGVAALDNRMWAQRLQNNEMARLEADLRSAGFTPKTAPRNTDAYGAAVREFVLHYPGRYPILETKQSIEIAEGKRRARPSENQGLRWELILVSIFIYLRYVPTLIGPKSAFFPPMGREHVGIELRAVHG